MQSPDQRKRTPAEIRDDLRMLRETNPHTYARQAARLLDELKQAERAKRRYALT